METDTIADGYALILPQLRIIWTKKPLTEVENDAPGNGVLYLLLGI